MQDNQNVQRLYFTAEKICIGSYKEVAEYEYKTKQSYWASDFFCLPTDYNPVDKSLADIELVEPMKEKGKEKKEKGRIWLRIRTPTK